MTIEEFLFKAFRDTARRVLWAVDDGKKFESKEYCSKFYSNDIRKLAEEALISGDTRKLDDTLSRLLFNLNADFGYDTKRPVWWSDAETQLSGENISKPDKTNASSDSDYVDRPELKFSQTCRGWPRFLKRVWADYKKANLTNPTKNELFEYMTDIAKNNYGITTERKGGIIYIKKVELGEWTADAFNHAFSRAKSFAEKSASNKESQNKTFTPNQDIASTK